MATAGWGYLTSQDLARAEASGRDLQAQLTTTSASLAATKDELSTASQRESEAEAQVVLQSAAAQDAAQAARTCNGWIDGLLFYVRDYSKVFNVFNNALQGNWSLVKFGETEAKTMMPFLNETFPTAPTDQQINVCRKYAPGGTAGS